MKKARSASLLGHSTLCRQATLPVIFPEHSVTFESVPLAPKVRTPLTIHGERSKLAG
jgi:hypothetical protein